MTKQRLDVAMTERGLTSTRSQAESWIKMGKVTVDNRVMMKPGLFVRPDSIIKLTAEDQYVSRAGLKLASVAKLLKLDFRDKIVLDVGSSTGGFTDYSLRNGAKKVYAVDVGTDQLHPSLQGHKQIELHEKTDIRDVVVGKWVAGDGNQGKVYIADHPDIVLIDVSFISLRDVLPHIYQLLLPHSQVVAMVKPQFEAGKDQTNKGIIKNDAMRRQILKDFELWAKNLFVIVDKRDSDVAGAKGNQERFYLLKLSK